MKLYVSCNRLCTNSYIEKVLDKNKLSIIKMYNNMLKTTNKSNEIY